LAALALEASRLAGKKLTAPRANISPAAIRIFMMRLRMNE